MTSVWQHNEESARKELKLASGGVDKEYLLEVGRLIFQSLPHSIRLLVDVGIELRNKELFDLADKIFAHISSVDDVVIFGFYELAISKVLQGKHVDAVYQCLCARSRDPDDLRVKFLLARLCSATGDTSRALQLLSSIDHANLPVKHAYVDFFRFCQTYDPFTGIRLAVGLSESANYLDTSRVADNLQSAIVNESPFSLIRLGDGEGAFLRFSKEDESDYRELHKQNRADRSSVWFDQSFDIYGSGFFDLTYSLHSAIVSADIVGIPYPTWVRHEYKILSMTGISTLINVLRIVAQQERQVFTAQNVHSDLMAKGYLSRIIAGCKRITVVSCHHALPDALKQRFGLSEVGFIALPPEYASISKLSSAFSSEKHFPDRYYEIIRSLKASRCSGLFLVAGGILGKLYCEAIKQSGGVALDIGSVADAWMGAMTRPNVTNAHVLASPHLRDE